MLRIRGSDRIVILAPHPDDESLATGGLLQRARATGTFVRILFGTDGENNPWPQRYLERHWRISAGDRARWATRRREEALAALSLLGIQSECVRFLNLPDQGITNILIRGMDAPLNALRLELLRAQPTLLVLPSSQDRHPDHAAFHVFARMALELSGLSAVRVVEYLVHSRGVKPSAHALTLKLSPHEQAKKRGAILCHATQMALSRTRFLRFATPKETFYLRAATRAGPQISEARFIRGALRLVVKNDGARAPGTKIIVAMQSLPGGSIRWSLPLPWRSACVTLRDEKTGTLLRQATVRVFNNRIEIRIPAANLHPTKSAFVQIVSCVSRSGWFEVPLTGMRANLRAQKPKCLVLAAGRQCFQGSPSRIKSAR